MSGVNEEVENVGSRVEIDVFFPESNKVYLEVIDKTGFDHEPISAVAVLNADEAEAVATALLKSADSIRVFGETN